MKVVRIVALACFALIGAGVVGLYLFKPDSTFSIFVKVVVLLSAALPGILLEFYLGQHKHPETDLMTAPGSETIYSTELLQFVFVLMLGVFTLDFL